MTVSFRRRFPAEAMAEINEAIAQTRLDQQDPLVSLAVHREQHPHHLPTQAHLFWMQRVLQLIFLI